MGKMETLKDLSNWPKIPQKVMDLGFELRSDESLNLMIIITHSTVFFRRLSLNGRNKHIVIVEWDTFYLRAL